MERLSKAAILIAVMLVLVTVPSPAQKNELSIGVGGYVPVTLTGVGAAVAIEGSYAHRVASVPFLAAYLEFPVVGTLKSTVTSAGLASSASYSALFFAPGLRLKLAPGFPVSPWLAAGGGLAHFGASAALGGGSVNTGVFDYGGGLDLKVAPFLSLRGEVRDFYSGAIAFSLAGFGQRQHNIVGTGGLVLRF